ncbi:hypothetical protein [Prolixibacter sp. NT017]|uniref:hypothetical protein n=1 Tax=Prolixibacter sp. NT017 TaxID=2652390 RepID=UPI00128502E4|nr:hypothetical protein [Prolixibacter sp. NT017]GET24278.1 hypothetical protein NT017_06070 [Prolixibacter sp. NT017]
MAVEIILSTVIAASTVIYTATSLMLWIESRASRKQKLTPMMVAYLKTTENHSILKLCIKNIGEGVAKDLSIKALQDYERLGKSHLLLSEIGVIKNGFNTFPPQYELKFYLGRLTEIYKKDQDGFVRLEFSYKSSDDRKFKEIFELPFKQIYGQNYSNPPESYIGQIPYYLKEINETLKAIDKVE